MDDEALLARWRRAVLDARATADPAAVDAAGRDLLVRWDEPHRRYHDRRHLTEVLTRVDELDGVARRPALVRLAAWFHDAVHAGHTGNDERASAALAGEVLVGLGVRAAAASEVQRLVLLTDGHVVADADADGAVLCDADLAVLAAPPPRYREYVGDVRAEYAQVPEAAFAAGRAAVLRRLLALPRLYRTPGGRTWEPQARANLAAELGRLERP